MRSLRLLLPALVALVILGCSGSGSRPAGSGEVIVDPYWEYRDEAERGEFSYDDSDDAPWIETETPVPEPPPQARMVQIAMDSLPVGFVLYVDRDGITVGDEDRVVRFWLLLTSGQGSASGSYEGYRCESAEYKVFAYANPARGEPLRMVTRGRWRGVDGPSGPTWRHELLRDYLCGIRGTRTAHEIRQSMTGTFQRETFFSH
jgi:hypothetical protein